MLSGLWLLGWGVAVAFPAHDDETVMNGSSVRARTVPKIANEALASVERAGTHGSTINPLGRWELVSC